jgi:glycosyltransferase involved in cell wall biosynthesis
MEQLRECIRTGQIVLLTETSDMSSLLKEELGFDVQDCLVLPCLVYTASQLAWQKPTSRLRVGFVGGLRAEKGYHLLPKILISFAKALQASSLAGRVEFSIQKHRSKSMRARWIKYHVIFSYLAVRLVPQIKFVQLKPYLSDKEFVTAMSEMDVLLLPYQLPTYKGRGSGIVLDGVMLGKPIVYTDGIGMSDLLSLGNAEAARNPSDFSEKLLKVLSNKEEYHASSVLARKVLTANFAKAAAYLRSL